ncbi:MAG: biotin transporter BioY [Gemmatimonadota bacterium]
MSTVAETVRSWGGQEIIAHEGARKAVAGLIFILAAALGAQVAVPLPWTPVPMTLQPLFVILAGAVLGPMLGASAMAGYVALGAAGLPVFAMGGAGLPWLLGPTGGYLVAMPAAAFFTGVVAARGAGPVRTAAGLALGVAVMYLGGLSWLVASTGAEPGGLLAVAVFPFLLGDATKILLALFLTRLIRTSSLGRV